MGVNVHAETFKLRDELSNVIQYALDEDERIDWTDSEDDPNVGQVLRDLAECLIARGWVTGHPDEQTTNHTDGGRA